LSVDISPPVVAYTHEHDPGTAGISPLRVANVILRSWRFVVLLPAVVAMTVGLIVLAQGRQYTSSVVFVPNSSASGLAQLAGLASKFGLPIPSQGSQQSPEFYADLVTNPSFLRTVASQRFIVTKDGRGNAGSLAQILRIDEPAPELALSRAVTQLHDEIVRSSSSVRSSMVTVSAQTESPELSQEIASALLKELQESDVKSRQFLADAERQFMEDRVAASQKELRLAEDQLQQFLEANREYRQDPKLAFAHDRLQRQVDMRQDVYTGLVQSFETARLEAIRNTPSISVVIPPLRALEPDKRNLVLKSLAAAVAAFLIATFLVIVKDSLLGRASDRSDAEEFASLTEGVRSFMTSRKRQ
jgi:uncharacterized protein involved in exopolysaccharide biosynthesis